MAYNWWPVVIIETHFFTRRITALMSDDEYKELQEALIRRSEMGAIISGTGGLRKVRWKLEGRGKSGGIRVIYYWMVNADQLYMLFGFPKNEQENLTAEQKRLLKRVVERWSDG